MIINHNLGAMNAIRNMNTNSANASKSMEKLSSGLRINTAADDAAGLAISEKMRGQIRGLDQASSNAQDGISMIQTAEGALNETTSILQRMRELAVQASNDTNTTDDRTQIQKEMNQLTSEITRIGDTTEFNTQKLLNGTAGTVTAGSTTAAAAAKVTGSAITLGASTDFSSTNLVFKVSINGGTDKTVTLNKNYDGSTNNMDNLVTDLNTAIGGSLVSKSADGKSLVITAANTTDTIEIKTATTGSLSAIGLTAGLTKPTAASKTAASSAFTFQIGANQDQQFTASISDMRSSALGLAGTAGGNATGFDGDVSGASYVTTGTSDDLSDVTNSGEHALDISTADKATAAVSVIDEATSAVSAERAKLGAYSNRLEHTIANLGTSSENLTSAESRIRDVDMASEMSEFSKNNILSQAAQAMLAQANQQPQQVLQLLR